MADCAGEWAYDASPQLYDCTQLASPSAITWRGMCGARAAASRPMQPALRTNLSWSPCGEGAAPRRWDAVRAIELLANRTLAIIGDSLGLYMFCAHHPMRTTLYMQPFNNPTKAPALLSLASPQGRSRNPCLSPNPNSTTLAL